MKPDNEPALQALRDQVEGVLREKNVSINSIGKEQPPEYDSRSNGATEIGVKLVKGLMRTITLCLESRLGRSIPVDHAIIPWLLL